MSLKQKLLLMVLGVLSSVIIVEIVLFCFSLLAPNSLENMSAYKKSKTGVEVLCLGDSFTYGIGAGFADSYPAQLETILKEQGVNVNVVNGGMPSANSAIVLARLKRFLKHIKPDIIVVTAGRNDIWNYKQLNRFYNWKVAVKAFFSQSRVYNLMLISCINLKNFFNKINNEYFNDEEKSNYKHTTFNPIELLEANELRDKGFLRQAINKYADIAQKSPENIAVLLEMSRCYRLNKQYEQAILILKKILLLDGDNLDALLELDDIFTAHKTLKQRRDFFYGLTLLIPESIEIKNEFVLTTVKLADEYYNKGDVSQAIVYYYKAINLAPSNAKVYNNLFFNKALESKKDKIKLNKLKTEGQFVWEITFDNISQIADICNQRKIPLILSGYPEEIYDAVITAARDYGIVFVDQRDAFIDKRAFPARKKYFTGDGHCTKQGYSIMAKTLADKIMDLLKN